MLGRRKPPKRCPSPRCRARLLWVRSLLTGHLMPLAPDVHDDGNVVVQLSLFADEAPAGIVLAGEQLNAARRAGVALYVHHAAVCADERVRSLR